VLVYQRDLMKHNSVKFHCFLYSHLREWAPNLIQSRSWTQSLNSYGSFSNWLTWIPFFILWCFCQTELWFLAAVPIMMDAFLKMLLPIKLSIRSQQSMEYTRSSSPCGLWSRKPGYQGWGWALPTRGFKEQAGMIFHKNAIHQIYYLLACKSLFC